MIVQPHPGLTVRAIGGVLDLFFFTGVGDGGSAAGPNAIVAQYWQLVHAAAGLQMPPYWALGFHLSRYGYFNESNLERTVNRTLAVNFPYVLALTVQLEIIRTYADWTAYV